MKGKFKNTMDELNFEKEVDFHHQIAYGFEKSYQFRINQKPQNMVLQANKEIMALLDNQLWILEIDPMILFYCLHFSVYYQNTEMIEFTRKLIDSLGLIMDPKY